MDSTAIKEKFKKLTIWKKGGKRAPHKPLLVLYALGKLLHNQSRLELYENIDIELKKLLIAFGSSHLNTRTEYPFWRLKNDNVWDIEGGEKIKENKSGDVKKSDLIKSNIKGGFKREIYERLRKDNQLFYAIVQEILNANFPSSIHEDILQGVGIDITTGKILKKILRDPEFREKVLRAYEYRCAVCGFDIRLGHYPIALEAAHIKWHQAGGPDIEVNGLALCALHHKLFDRGAFTLSKDFKVQISDRAYGTVGFNEWLMKFHGEKIKYPQRKDYLPDNSFRTWHVREVFQGEFRSNNAEYNN